MKWWGLVGSRSTSTWAQHHNFQMFMILWRLQDWNYDHSFVTTYNCEVALSGPPHCRYETSWGGGAPPSVAKCILFFHLVFISELFFSGFAKVIMGTMQRWRQRVAQPSHLLFMTRWWKRNVKVHMFYRDRTKKAPLEKNPSKPWHPALCLFVCCSPFRQQNKHLDHTFLISVSGVKPTQSSVCGNMKAGFHSWRSHMKNTPYTHSIHTGYSAAFWMHFPSLGLCWVFFFHPGWIERTCAPCESQLDGVEPRWQDFPQSVSPLQSWLAVRDAGAPQHRLLISIPINNWEYIYVHQWSSFTSHALDQQCDTWEASGLYFRQIITPVLSPNTHTWTSKVLLVFQLCGK